MDTKKLRQKVLDLAIRGKLVPQDPNDEPASVLLERIRTEKERLIKKGKIKRSKKSASDDEIEAPFEIPESWEWVRLDDIAYFGGGKTPSMEEKRYWQNGRNLWITSKDMKCDRISDSLMKISDEALPIMTQYNPGTLLMVTRSGILRHSLPIAILEKVATVNQDLKTISFYFYDIAEYIFYSIKAKEKYILKEYHKDGTTVDSINFEKFIDILLPLPSLNEQKRIINEVERWFTLIDELESNEGDLLKAIDKAKSKVLDLAIHGKLVPQDPNDEPAIDLLKRINPKFEPCDNNTESRKIPESWCLSNLKSVCTDLIVPQRDKPTRFDGDIPWCRIEDIEGKYLNGSLSNQNVSLDLIKEMNMRICPIGTVLCSCSASLGIQAITTVECCTNQTFIGIVPQKNVLKKDFLYYFLMSQTKKFYDIGTGTTIKYISRAKFEELTIPIPPLQEQICIIAKIEELFAVLDSIKESLEI